MKFVLCHVCSLFAAFGFLAVLSTSTVSADEKAKKEVVVESEVVVVAEGEEDATIAEAIKKALREKLDGLPEEVREKIESKVKQAHQIQIPIGPLSGEINKRIQLKLAKAGDAADKQSGEVAIQAKVIIIDDDGETRVIDLLGNDTTSASAQAVAKAQKQQTFHVQADATADGKVQVHVKRADDDQKSKKGVASAKNVRLWSGKTLPHQPHAIQVQQVAGDDHKLHVTIVEQDGEKSTKADGAKSITVELKDGQIILNGKPLTVDTLMDVAESAMKRVEVRVRKADDDDSQPEVRRRVMVLGKDGKMKELDVDQLKQEQDARVKKAHDAMKKQQAEMAKKHGELVKKHQALAKEMAAKHAAMAKKLQAEALKKQAGITESHALVGASVSSQLKEIKAELVKIRKLLEEIQEDEDDDEDEDEDD